LAGTQLMIKHIATGHEVIFDNFALTEFQDNIATNWNKTQVYGRMDPIMTYQGSERNISMAINWTSLTAKSKIHIDITQLMAFQYPTYSEFNNALAIERPPLVRVQFLNFMQAGVYSETSKRALLCAMKGCAFTPQVGFTPEDSPLVRYGGKQKLNAQGQVVATGLVAESYPKVISLKLDFDVLHEETPGWKNEGAKYEWIDGTLNNNAESAFGPGAVLRAASQGSGEVKGPKDP